jgi:hypothetical protein
LLCFDCVSEPRRPLSVGNAVEAFSTALKS